MVLAPQPSHTTLYMPFKNTYNDYTPCIAFGFKDVGYKRADLLYKDGTHVKVHSMNVYKDQIHGPFIGIVCTFDTSGNLSYTPEAHEELMRFIEVYKAFHNIQEEITLSYCPVISGNWTYDYSYTLLEGIDHSDSDCE